MCECVGQVVPARRQRGLGSPPGGSRAPPPPPPRSRSRSRLRRVSPAAAELGPRSARSVALLTLPLGAWAPSAAARRDPNASPLPGSLLFLLPLPPPSRPPSLPPSQQPPPLPPQAQRSGDSRPPAAASSSRKFELPQPQLTLRCGASAVGFRRGDSPVKVCPSFPSRHRSSERFASLGPNPRPLGWRPPPPRPLPSPPPLGPSWLRTPRPGARPGRTRDRLGRRRRRRGRPADPKPRGWGRRGRLSQPLAETPLATQKASGGPQLP